MGKFKTIVGTMSAGEKMIWGDGGFPITDIAESALLATVPPPPPPPPVMQYFIAPKDAPNRGHGFDASKFAPTAQPMVFRDKFIRGYAQNFVVENYPHDVRLENIRCTEGWRDDPSQKYQGQGFYFDKCGRVTLVGCAAWNNGWQPDRPANRRSMFLHGVYQNVGCKFLDIQWGAFGSNPNAGVEFKGAGQTTDSLLFDNGTGLLGLKGPLTAKRCVILDGHRYAGGTDANNQPASWTGNVGVQTYCPTALEDIAIVGGPSQLAPDLTPAKASNMGAINGSKSYPGTLEDGTTPQGASWSINRVYESSWLGPTVSGDAAPFTVIPPWQPAAVPSIAQIIARLNDPMIPVKDTVMWVFTLMKVPWLSTYK